MPATTLALDHRFAVREIGAPRWPLRGATPWAEDRVWVMDPLGWRCEPWRLSSHL